MRLLIIAAVLGCVALGRSPLSAQRTVHLGLGGGASLPQGSLGSGVSTGWHALGSIVVGVPMLPLGLQRLKFDPASASAPMVATLVDVMGLVIYFTVASLLVL